MEISRELSEIGAPSLPWGLLVEPLEGCEFVRMGGAISMHKDCLGVSYRTHGRRTVFYEYHLEECELDAKRSKW